jgi:hypothetical protein
MSTAEIHVKDPTSFGTVNNIRTSSDWLPESPSVDLLWVANTYSHYAAALRKLPSVFAWEECPEYLNTITTLMHSVTSRRLRSCFDFIGYYDSSLRISMQFLFQKLPLSSQRRFTTAPETFYRISRMRWEPVDSIIALCNMLNGEAAMSGLGSVKSGYVSALGDYFVVDQDKPKQFVNSVWDDSIQAWVVRAPIVASRIPVDFSSPLVENAQESKVKKTYGKYSAEQQAQICNHLNRTIELIGKASSSAADLIRTFIKVIVPLNSASGHGSTSQPRIPGRVLLSGVERSSESALASALVHESIHQLMYILEWNGSFITPDADANDARATSLWTGRDLPLHSFIHACFVWYGVSNFWLQARSRGVFDQNYLNDELQRCTSGFKDRNPIEMLAPHATKVRYEVYKIASTLRTNLQERLSACALNE